MSKTIHFVSGLPRAGSTLLMNLLAQHPQVHATATSGLHEIGYIARQFSATEEFKTIPDPKHGETLFYDYVKGGCENAFNRLTDRPIVADKCRSWIGHLDMLFAIWPDAKVLDRYVFVAMTRTRNWLTLIMDLDRPASFVGRIRDHLGSATGSAPAPF